MIDAKPQWAQPGHQQVWHVVATVEGKVATAGDWVSPAPDDAEKPGSKSYKYLEKSPNYAFCSERKGLRAGEPRKVSRFMESQPDEYSAVCPKCVRSLTDGGWPAPDVLAGLQPPQKPSSPALRPGPVYEGEDVTQRRLAELYASAPDCPNGCPGRLVLDKANGQTVEIILMGQVTTVAEAQRPIPSDARLQAKWGLDGKRPWDETFAQVPHLAYQEDGTFHPADGQREIRFRHVFLGEVYLLAVVNHGITTVPRLSALLSGLNDRAGLAARERWDKDYKAGMDGEPYFAKYVTLTRAMERRGWWYKGGREGLAHWSAVGPFQSGACKADAGLWVIDAISACFGRQDNATCTEVVEAFIKIYKKYALQPGAVLVGSRRGRGGPPTEACVIGPSLTQRGRYEVRLKDGTLSVWGVKPSSAHIDLSRLIAAMEDVTPKRIVASAKEGTGGQLSDRVADKVIAKYNHGLRSFKLKGIQNESPRKWW